MNYLPAYLDSSAVLKMVLPEPEGPALARLLADTPDRVSSVILTVECRRALSRARRPTAILARLEDVLETITLIRLDDVIVELASRVGSPVLRSLDALHLASALSMGDDPAAFITYDDRLAVAARKLKLRVLQPGR